jgi:ArsR family transcriptional regulator, arsenate/arsenite/antimonite-responsive transcriptional repressor
MIEVTDSEAALIGKALGDPTRLGIYTRIAENKELYCGEMGAYQTISGATISHHLRVLTHAGLIQSRRSGQHIFYRAIPARLAAYRRYLSNVGKCAKRLPAEVQ